MGGVRLALVIQIVGQSVISFDINPFGDAFLYPLQVSIADAYGLAHLAQGELVRLAMELDLGPQTGQVNFGQVVGRQSMQLNLFSGGGGIKHTDEGPDEAVDFGLGEVHWKVQEAWLLLRFGG